MAKPKQLKSGHWRIRWLDESSVRRSATFPTHRQAKSELARRQAEVTEIKLGLRDARPPEKTFDDLCDYWIRARLPGRRSRRDHESMILRHLRPTFGSLRLRDIRVEHSDQYVTEHGHLANKTVNNHLTLLISMLNVAVDLRWITRAPRIKKHKVRAIAEEYRYLRSDEEIGRFLRAAQEEGDAVHILYATAIYTGMRQGELAGLAWSDVDFEGRLITVQRSFKGPTKSGDVRYVPLLDVLLPQLRAWRLRCPSRLVFENRLGKMHAPSARIFQEVLHRVLRRAGFPEEVRRGRPWRYIRFHDLRHTFASHWMKNGGDIFKLQRVLGHKSMDMTQRYAHLAPDAFKEDLGRFGGAPAEGVVIPLTTSNLTG